MTEKVRLYVYISPQVLTKLTDLAKQYDMSRSGMASMFISTGMRVFNENTKKEAEVEKRRWELALEQSKDVAGIKE